MSAHQTWFARSIAKPRSRYGNILCPGAGLLVRGFGPSAAMSIVRINRHALAIDGVPQYPWCATGEQLLILSSESTRLLPSVTTPSDAFPRKRDRASALRCHTKAFRWSPVRVAVLKDLKRRGVL